MKPLRDRVIVKRLDAETVTKGGIYIPDAVAAKDKPTRGKVVAVGPGKVLADGSILAPTVNVGDLVLFGRYTGSEITVEGEKLVVMNEDDIQAVLEE